MLVQGLAISITPAEATLPAWGRAVVQLTAYNDMCGDYCDTLHIQVSALHHTRPLDLDISAGEVPHL
jgi:hypothetical protein